MDLLLSSSAFGIVNATRVLVTGGSAGGIGTFLNIDYIQQRLPSAVVKGAPNAGWFFPGDPNSPPSGCGFPVTFDDWVSGKPTPWTNETDILWDAFDPPECAVPTVASGLPAWFCGSVHNLYPHIKAPLLVVENQYDTNQIFTQLGAPKNPATPKDKANLDGYITYFGERMRNSTERVGKSGKDGLFLPSCLEHGVQNSTKIRGVTCVTQPNPNQNVT
jgi:hypothetical protein